VSCNVCCFYKQKTNKQSKTTKQQKQQNKFYTQGD
jgi:hypothetical protein